MTHAAKGTDPPYLVDAHLVDGAYEFVHVDAPPNTPMCRMEIDTFLETYEPVTCHSPQSPLPQT